MAWFYLLIAIGAVVNGLIIRSLCNENERLRKQIGCDTRLADKRVEEIQQKYVQADWDRRQAESKLALVESRLKKITDVVAGFSVDVTTGA